MPDTKQQTTRRLVPGQVRDLTDRVREELTSIEPTTPSWWQRRLFHALATGAGATAMLLAPESGVQWFMIAASLIAVAIELGRGLLPIANEFAIRYIPLFKPKERYEIMASTYLWITATFAVFVFDKDIVVLALAFVAVGDPAAALIGRWDKWFRVFGKSVVGATSFTLAAAAAGWLVTLHPDVAWTPWIIVGAAVAAVAEMLPLPFDDNITTPLAAAVALTLML